MSRKLAYALYRRLLWLYPQPFSEQFGESMTQTFQDLWRDQARTKKQWFAFVFWLFFDTIVGIGKEYVRLIWQGVFMASHLKILGASAIIGLLVVLPFALLEIINRQQFNEGFPFSLFVGMWLLPAIVSLILLPVVQQLRTENHLIANPTQPKSTARISVLLALPFVLFYLASLFGIEPNLSSFGPPVSTVGPLIFMGSFLLALTACFIARTAIVRSLDAGGTLLTQPIQWAVIALVLLPLVLGWGALVMDQMPCFLGVPNCD